MKLIFENDSNLSYIISEELNEASGSNEKKYRIKGIFSTIGEQNRNGRVYPRQIWETQVQKYQENFSKGSLNLLCEWQHPPRSKVDPMEAVAKIEKLYIKDKYVMGEAVLLNNPKANQLKSLIDAGIKLSVSSRGVGSVKNGVVDSFSLITYDLVDEPSDYAATMNGMVESFRLTEGVLEDKNFQISESGSIEEIQVCSSDACHLFEKKDIDLAIKEKFNSILECFKSSSPEILDKQIDRFNSKKVNATFTDEKGETKKVSFNSEQEARSYAKLMHWTYDYSDGKGTE